MKLSNILNDSYNINDLNVVLKGLKISGVKQSKDLKVTMCRILEKIITNPEKIIRNKIWSYKPTEKTKLIETFNTISLMKRDQKKLAIEAFADMIVSVEGNIPAQRLIKPTTPVNQQIVQQVNLSTENPVTIGYITYPTNEWADLPPGEETINSNYELPDDISVDFFVIDGEVNIVAAYVGDDSFDTPQDLVDFFNNSDDYNSDDLDNYIANLVEFDPNSNEDEGVDAMELSKPELEDSEYLKDKLDIFIEDYPQYTNLTDVVKTNIVSEYIKANISVEKLTKLLPAKSYEYSVEFIDGVYEAYVKKSGKLIMSFDFELIDNDFLNSLEFHDANGEKIVVAPKGLADVLVEAEKAVVAYIDANSGEDMGPYSFNKIAPNTAELLVDGVTIGKFFMVADEDSGNTITSNFVGSGEYVVNFDDELFDFILNHNDEEAISNMCWNYAAENLDIVSEEDMGPYSFNKIAPNTAELLVDGVTIGKFFMVADEDSGNTITSNFVGSGEYVVNFDDELFDFILNHNDEEAISNMCWNYAAENLDSVSEVEDDFYENNLDETIWESGVSVERDTVGYIATFYMVDSHEMFNIHYSNDLLVNKVSGYYTSEDDISNDMFTVAKIEVEKFINNK